MDEDPMFSANNEEKPAQEDIVVTDDDDDDDDDSSTENSTPCLMQSSFLVPKINLGTSSPSSTCKDALGATLTYGLISTPGIPQQNDQELFVLDNHLLPDIKFSLNPMAKEFKPTACRQFSQNDYSAVVSAPTKMRPSAFKRFPPSTSADGKLLSQIAEILKDDKLLILMRGCPGSGKTTLAEKIYSSLEKCKTGVILSTDNYFNMNGSHYRYDSTKLPGAHAWNKSQAYTAMTENIDLIIIDNTNVTKWEMAPYVKLAYEKHYKVELVEPNTHWKFKARKLVEYNIHGVNLSKIQDMLSRYEKGVTVKQLLGTQKKPEEKSHTDKNAAKAQRRANHKRKKKADHSGDTNNNKDNINNNDQHSTSPPEMLKTNAFFDNDITTEMSPTTWSDQGFMDIPWADQEFTDTTREDRGFTDTPKTDQEFSESESWGSDEWYEPQAQRLPKKTVKISDEIQDQFSGSGSSTENLQEMLALLPPLNKEKHAVEDLALLALKCIEKFGNEEIYERASSATVEGCQWRNKILFENFEKKVSKKHIHKDLLPLIKDNLSSLACDMESLKESPNFLPIEDTMEISPEEQNEFYVIFSLKSDFLNLLTQMFGPIDNLTSEEANQNENVDLKLNYDDMKCLHQSLSRICAVKKGSVCSKEKRKPKSKKILPSSYSSMSNSSKEGFMHQPESLAEIMKEQEKSTFKLKQKLQRNDYATTKKLEKLCSAFPGYDPDVIEDIFKGTDYNMHETFAVLQGHPQRDAIDWRFSCNTAAMPTAPKNKPKEGNGRHHLNWLKISEEDQAEVVEFYCERLKDSVYKRNMYCNRSYDKVVSYFREKVDEFKIKLKNAQLSLLKQNVASLLTIDTYNKIDLHGMSKSQAGFIVRECLKDYAEASKNSSSMKNCLIFVTGKGSNSKNKKPVLKPYIINFLETNNYQYIKEAGEVKVFV